MQKIWMVLALAGAVGCSGSPSDSTDSQSGALDKGTAVAKGAGGDTALPGCTGTTDANGGKDDANGGKGDANGGNPCDPELALLLQEMSKTTDSATLLALKDKYSVVQAGCAPAPANDCAAELDAIPKAMATASTPEEQSALKEKYTAVQATCAPPPAADACATELAVLVKAMSAEGDPTVLAALKSKYAEVQAGCKP